MTALTFKVKPTADGGFEIELKPTQYKEPEILEMPYTCMPGTRRRQNIPTIV
jgi:hypothetical protein